MEQSEVVFGGVIPIVDNESCDFFYTDGSVYRSSGATAYLRLRGRRCSSLPSMVTCIKGDYLRRVSRIDDRV